MTDITRPEKCMTEVGVSSWLLLRRRVYLIISLTFTKWILYLEQKAAFGGGDIGLFYISNMKKIMLISRQALAV